MKIEKAKVFSVGERTFHSLREAQRYLLEAWFVHKNATEIGSMADAILNDPEGFREVVAPFIFKPRGRRPKAVEGQAELSLGEVPAEKTKRKAA